jgi:hypothetical protein
MISDTARKRVATLKKGGVGMFASSAVSRIAPTTSSREAVSAADAKAVRTRQQAEALPEGDVRRGARKRRGGTVY